MKLLKPYKKSNYSSNVVRSYISHTLDAGLKNYSNEPKAYQQGWVEFYKLKFKVTPDVLIPRPETELLVDEVLEFARSIPKGMSLKILDVGTGAGNIAISIAKNLPDAKIIATDISPKALRVAKQNAKFHGVSNQIAFLQSNLLQNIQRPWAKLSTMILVTNLPYIPSQRIPYLDSSVKDYEPLIALDGGKDGFELYRKLFQQISRLHTGFVIESTHRVCQPKLIVCEIDYTHGELAANEAQKYFPKAEVEVKTDLSHKQRILRINLEKPLFSRQVF